MTIRPSGAIRKVERCTSRIKTGTSRRVTSKLQLDYECTKVIPQVDGTVLLERTKNVLYMDRLI